jgi:hypothetical protein
MKGRGRLLLILAALAAVVLLVRLAYRPAPPEEAAHVGRRQVTLWSHWGQVRQPVAELRYGVRVTVLEHRGEMVRVRSEQGHEGWLRADLLISPDIWERTLALAAETRAMPVQARAKTRSTTSLRAQPGRESPTLLVLPAGVEADVLRRATAERPAEAGAPAGLPPRREDWLLVRARPESVGEISGWALARSLAPQLPEPLAERAGQIRFVAWLELNRVPDPARGEQPQYAAFGVSGPEGGSCDFTLLRVYTWNAARARYETAYVESALCGRLPVLLSTEDSWPTFRFNTIGADGEAPRAYQLRHTVVRRLAR